MVILLAIATIVVGIGAIVNAVRLNRERHGERRGESVTHGDLHAIG
jgi:hypothetical protein